MKENSKFLTLYNQIMEEVATYLEKDNKLTHGEKSSFGTSGSSMYKLSNSDSSDSGSSGMTTDNNSDAPPADVKTEDAGMTAVSVMGPSSPSQSLANTASVGNSLNVPHDDAGLTTADLKPIYCPAIPYKKKRKLPIAKRKTFTR